ncbi:MAG: molybdopterin-dependent oxidoreductase [Thermomicrobiales bacterium]
MRSGSADRRDEFLALMDEDARSKRQGMVAGALAAIAALVTMIGLRAITGIVSLLDILADGLLLALPISVFSGILSLFGKQAKTSLLIGLMLAIILIGAWCGRMVAKGVPLKAGTGLLWARAVSWSMGLFAIAGAFAALYVLGRMPDIASGLGVVRVVACILGAMTVFALVLGGVLVLLRADTNAAIAATTTATTTTAATDAPTTATTDGSTSPRLDRRRLVTQAGLGVATLAGLVVLGREVARIANRTVVVGGRRGTMPPAITPNDEFYLISKNFLDPSPDRGANWSIDILGLVQHRITLTAQDLEPLAGPVFVSTLTCISNPIAGPLIGTAEWTGVPLAKVLGMAGVMNGATKLVSEGEDGYTDSIPIERALSAEPHIVWKMNGEPLPPQHGSPVRLIVPGLYGIKNVKWLTKMTVTADDYQGYWQQRGWTDTAIIKTSSRIDVPGDRAVIASAATEIGGVAFAGDRGIAKVEVSTDDGATWREATITDNPSPSGLSWVLWTLPWTPESGAYTLVVRATDGKGELQTSDSAPELPDGASGWHRITVGVA